VVCGSWRVLTQVLVKEPGIMVRQTLATLVRIEHAIGIILTRIGIILTRTRCVIVLRLLGLALKDQRSSVLDHLGHGKTTRRLGRMKRRLGRAFMFPRFALKDQRSSVPDRIDYFKTAHGDAGKLN